MKKLYICGVERLGYWIEERYLGCYSSWGSCGVVELPGGLRDCTSCVSGVACSSGVVEEGLVELRPGARRYELSDWLGNVRVVVTDQRIAIRGNDQVVVGYRSEVVEVRDYYSCGLDIFQHFHFVRENNWVMRLLGGNLDYSSHSYIIKASECDLGVYSRLNMQRYPKFKAYLSKVDPMDKAPSPRHLDEALKEKGLIKNDEDGKR
jgi:hypothetical protein